MPLDEAIEVAAPGFCRKKLLVGFGWDSKVTVDPAVTKLDLKYLGHRSVADRREARRLEGLAIDRRRNNSSACHPAAFLP